MPKIPKIPINLNALSKAGQAFVGQGNDQTIINILVDKTAPLYMIDSCRQKLKPEPQSAQISVVSFYDEMPKLDSESTLTIVLAGDSPYCSRLSEVGLWSDHPLLTLSTDIGELINNVDSSDAVAITQNILEFPKTDDATDESYLKAVEKLFVELTKWCSRELPDARINLGRAFAFMRQTIAFDLTKQTALENSVIAAVFFLPGADLPILTLNQCKLLYQIAVIYGIPLTASRFKELAVIIAAAFGCRGFVRLVLRKPIPAAWAVRGAISYSATLMVGHLAYQFYSNGGDFKQIAQQVEQEGYVLKDNISNLPARLLPQKASNA